MNYDCDKLFLEVRKNNQWTDVKGDFTSIDLKRSVGVEKGLLFRPEAAQMSLTTKSTEYAEGVFGMPVRLMYDGSILFTGKVTKSQTSAVPSDDGPNYSLTIEATDSTDEYTKIVKENYTRPEETVEQRVDALGLPGVVVNDAGRLMAARTEPEAPTVMEIMQDAADAQLARFYVNAENDLVLDANRAPEPDIIFSDSHVTSPSHNLTNLIPNPSMEGSMWHSQAGGGLLRTDRVFSGDHSFGKNSDFFLFSPSPDEATISLTSTSVFSASVATWGGDGGLIRINWFDENKNLIATTESAYLITGGKDKWTVFKWENITKPPGAVYARIWGYLEVWDAVPTLMYADAFMLNEGATVAEYFDGDTPEHMWVGDPHNSPSRPERHVCFNNVGMGEDITNAVSGVIVRAKQDDTKVAVRRATNAVINNQERYDVDLPFVTNGDLAAWATGFPLHAYTTLEPTTLNAAFSEIQLDIELLSLVGVRLDGQTFSSGVKGITHSITPRHWAVSYDLIPGHVLKYETVTKPSPVSYFGVIEGATQLAVDWQPPKVTGSMNRYMIRYAEGTTVAPSTPTAGRLFYEGTDLEYTKTGLNPYTQYALSIFPMTGTAGVYGDARTLTIRTLQQVPTAPRNVTITRLSATSVRVNWDAPATPGSMSRYQVNRRVGVYPVDINDGISIYNGTGTSVTVTGLERNKRHFFKMWAVTPNGLTSPQAFNYIELNETVPTVPRNFSATAPNYQTVVLSWTAPATMGDIDHYRITNNYGSTMTATKSQTSKTLSAQGDTNYTFTIIPVTAGGLTGPSTTASVKTPVGIVSKTWSGYATWHQSYRQNNTKATSFYAAVCKFGYWDGNNGNSKSMIGFNVPNEVKNAVEITSVRLRYTLDHSYYNAGVDVRLGTHTNSSKPNTFGNAALAEATYFDSPEATVTRNITSWAADNFKAGAKGISVGPGVSSSQSYYGYLYGSGAVTAKRPWLEIKYKVRTS